jgi:2-keto-4-pentenoate hydratase/2-oxohepta-3-ene-1,7-dioic acid hydratase in catechol pathway
MRLVTFTDQNTRDYRVGALMTVDSVDFVLDLQQARTDLPRSMPSLLRVLDGDFETLASLVRSAPVKFRLPLSRVALGPVVLNPEKILCIGLNYRDHAVETNHALPETPTIFAKYANTLIGSGECIRLPDNTSRVDYEAELAFIIGRRAKNIRVEDALDYVAGYAAFNDVSARDFQLRTSQWTLGKSFDTFAPLGPFLVTKEDVPNPHALRIKLSIGNEVLQDSNTANLIFKIPELLSYISSVMTLEPGDVIATGTPAGVGFTRTPPRYLQVGETVRVEIDGLGVLENCVQSINEGGVFERRLYQ